MSTITVKDLRRGVIVKFPDAHRRPGFLGIVTKVNCPNSDWRSWRFGIKRLVNLVADPFELPFTEYFDSNGVGVGKIEVIGIRDKEVREFVEKRVKELDNKVHDAKRKLKEAEIERGNYRTIASEFGLYELKGE